MSTVSAIMMCKNGDDYIRYAIKSIIDYVDELLIYDTGSEDRTIDIVESFKSSKVKIFKTKVNKTLAELKRYGSKDLTDIKNELVNRATKDWILVNDQDMVWERDMIEAQIKVLDRMERPYVLNRDIYYLSLEERRVWFGNYQVKFFRNNMDICYIRKWPRETLTKPYSMKKNRTDVSNVSMYASPFYYHHFSCIKKYTLNVFDKENVQYKESFIYRGLLPEVMRKDIK